MSKRDTDSDKWKKGFMKSLSTEMKLIWLYILDECDIAGVWEVEWEILLLRTGINFNQHEAEKILAEKIDVFDDGKKWFIVEFIEFQYCQLSEKNRLHLAVLKKLEIYRNKGLTRALQGPKELSIKNKVEGIKEKVEGIKTESESFSVSETETKKFKIEDCFQIAMRDSRWVLANAASECELFLFNSYLERLGEYEFNPIDYKKYFAKLKGKYPEMLKKEYSVEELREAAKNMTWDDIKLKAI